MDESNIWINKGVELAEVGKYGEALECFDKALEIDNKYIYAWFCKGLALYGLGRKEEAIECYDKALEINPKDSVFWYNKGITLYKLGKKEEAIECYDKALEIDDKYVDAWNNKGIALSDSSRKDEAIVCYDKALEIDNKYVNAWGNKGNVLDDLGRKEEAIECYDKVLEIDNKDTTTWNNKGIVLSALGRYEEAIECYNEALKINNKYVDAWNNKGLALSNLGRNDEAIDFYDEALEIDNRYVNAWNNKGVALENLRKYKEALEAYEEAIKLNPNSILFKNNKGDVLVKLKEFKEAADTFIEANADILGIMVRLQYEPSEDIEETVNYMLDEDDFFNQIVPKDTDTEKRILYKKLYYKSLYIISLLYVGKDKEPLVAHYTSKKTSESFMFPKDNNNKIWLSSIINSNDPKEGQTLLDAILLDKNCFSELIQQETYRAFAGCFTFNEERLNQFRLYGKEGGQEATGVSLVLNQDFFSSEIKRSTPLSSNDEKKEEAEETLPLFRCIYIDPNTGHIASIGQREEYSFYRYNKESDFPEYNDYIEKTLKEVREKLKDLEDYIIDKELDIDNKDRVCKLLINLRYLTKHVAFKEEQECRVIRIERIDDENVNVDKDRLYMDYLPVRKYVERICFAPKTPGMELYSDKLKHDKSKVICYRCDHPFVG